MRNNRAWPHYHVFQSNACSLTSGTTPGSRFFSTGCDVTNKSTASCRTVSAWLVASIILTAARPVVAGDEKGQSHEATVLDRSQYVISESIDDFARWLDSFFDDERIVTEDASTRLRVSQGVLFEQGERFRLKTRLNVKFNVPHFKNRLKLFVADENTNADNNPVIDEIGLDETGEEAELGLQYFAKASDRQNLSLTTGVKLDSLEVFAGPRYRRTVRLNGWQLRFTQRFRWFTRRGWESGTRLDLENLLGRSLLFRQTIEGRWRKEDEGYRYEVSPTLIQPLRNRNGLEYRWGNAFRTRPNHRFEESVLRVRYRQQVWRRWLFYEVAPQLAFRNDDDFKPVAGINLRLEVVFGANGHAIRR